MNAVELIAQYSENEDALIVCDPPYLTDDTTEATAERSKKAVACYEKTINYNELIPVLKQSKSKILLCNYNNELLRTELVSNGWKQIAIGTWERRKTRNTETGLWNTFILTISTHSLRL